MQKWISVKYPPQKCISFMIFLGAKKTREMGFFHVPVTSSVMGFETVLVASLLILIVNSNIPKAG